MKSVRVVVHFVEDNGVEWSQTLEVLPETLAFQEHREFRHEYQDGMFRPPIVIPGPTNFSLHGTLVPEPNRSA